VKRSRSPAILLHGFTGSPASWDAAIAAAPVGSDATALALPGHGSAPVADFAGALAALANDIEAAGLGGAQAIGYSMGARLALGLLVERPGLLSGATLIGVQPGLEDEAERRRRLEADRRWIEILRAGDIERFVAAWESLPMWDSQRRCDPAALEAQRRIRLRHDPGALAEALETMGLSAMPAYRSRISEINVPVEIVAGELDRKFCDLGQSLVAEHPRLSLRVIAGVGHNVPLEAPEAVWG
jgi:2-succinyl-6-hydroxy-2,4-cyclohexadiene-1-carboxylate synthase